MTSTALAREIERYVAKTPKSRALQAEAEQVLPGGSSRGTAYFAPYPFFAEHGDGHYVYDVDGNRYLDFMLNATTLIVGHANPMVVEALGEQTRKGTAFRCRSGLRSSSATASPRSTRSASRTPGPRGR